LAVSPGDKPAVRVDAYQDAAPMSVWIDTTSDSLLHEEPPAQSSTSFAAAMHIDLPQWTAAANNVRSSVQSSEQVRPELAVIPPECSPPDQLPIKTVRSFTFGIFAWWILAMCIHICRQSVALYKSFPQSEFRIATTALIAEWPNPAGFFEISSLSCNTSHVLISDSAFLYKAERLAERKLSAIQEIGNNQAATVLCRANSCHALTVLGSEGLWSLIPLGAEMSFTQQKIPLPPLHQSLHPISAAWGDCSSKGCQSMWVAGWNGLSAITVFKLDARRKPGAWTLARQFKLTPHIGHCQSLQTKCETADLTYSDIQALQFTSNGQALLVLTQGRVLDGWDLVVGRFAGRWYLPQEHQYLTICHDGQNLMLARLGERGSGPVLETAATPAALAGRFQAQNRTGCGSSKRKALKFLGQNLPANASLLV